MFRRILVYCGAVALFVACLSVAPAQDMGAINGQVFDQSKAPVPNVTVSAVNQDTGLTRQAVSNPEGAFFIQALPPGRYTINAQISGFKAFSQTGIQVSVGQNARADVRLEVGTVTENVTVAANALAVDTQGSTVGGTIDNERLAALPLLDRNVLSLAVMLPGVGQATLPTIVTNSRSGPTISVAGGRLRDNNFMLDGATLVSTMYMTPQNLPQPDALEEFRVLTNTYAAEYGSGVGSIFLAVTKSGNNTFHGNIFEYFRNDKLNARNAFSTSVPLLRQNQFGASLGGPVTLPFYKGRDRTFFFFAYQGLRVSQQGLSTSFPATLAERAGDFSATAKPVIDPTTNVPFGGNQIPTSRMDPLSVNVYRLYQPLLPTQANGQNTLLQSTRLKNDQISTKFDHSFSQANKLSVRYFRNGDGSREKTPVELLPVIRAGADVPVQSILISDTHSFSPVTLVEFRASYTRVPSILLDSRVKQKSAKELGGNFDQPTAVSPQVGISSRAGVSPGTISREIDNQWQVEAKFSRVTGRHALKFGGAAWYARQLTATKWRANGIFTFDGLFTGNSMADYFLGKASGLLIACDYYAGFRGADYAGYAQDDFTVNRRLTLNYGVRYQLHVPFRIDNGYMANFIPYRQSTFIPSAPPGMVYVGDEGVPNGIYKLNKKHFEPRFGFAWDVFGTGKTAVRGGYGMITRAPSGTMQLHEFENPPFQRVVSMSPPTSFSNPYGGGKDPFPWQLDLKNPTWAFPFQAFGTDADFGDQYTQQFNLNIQQQFSSDWFVQVGYVGKVSHKLPVVNEYNFARFGPGATAANVDARRPYYPQYYAGIGINHADANSNYHSLQLEARKRLSNSFSMQLAYTWSKSIDEGSNDNAEGSTTSNPYNYLKGERGLSAFHRGSVLAVSGVYDLPGFGGANLAARMFGGWRLSGTLQVSSGAPFSVVTGRDTALLGASRALGGQRAEQVGVATLDTSRPRAELIQKYFNTAAFVSPAIGAFGSSGRNILIGPGSVNANLAVLKNFRLSARESLGKMQLRAEAYNLTNVVNLGTPSASLTASNFGTINSAGPARIIQIGLRYDF